MTSLAAGEKKQKKEEQKRKGRRKEKLRLDISMKTNDFHCVKFSVMIKHFTWVLKLFKNVLGFQVEDILISQ